MASKLLGTYLVILDTELENNLNNNSWVLYSYFIAVRGKELVLWNPGALWLSINLELFLFYKENAERKKKSLFFHCYNWIKVYTESIVYGSNEVTLERTGMGDNNYYCKSILRYSFFLCFDNKAELSSCFYLPSANYLTAYRVGSCFTNK